MATRVMVVFLILVEDGECEVVECDGCNPFNEVPALPREARFTICVHVHSYPQEQWNSRGQDAPTLALTISTGCGVDTSGNLPLTLLESY